MITIELLARGIEQVNQVFIEQPELDGNYPAMAVQYLMSALLVSIGGKANDFGFYSNPDKVGYTGWIGIGDKVLFFAPTKAVILEQLGEINGELSPYGILP